ARPGPCSRSDAPSGPPPGGGGEARADDGQAGAQSAAARDEPRRSVKEVDSDGKGSGARGLLGAIDANALRDGIQQGGLADMCGPGGSVVSEEVKNKIAAWHAVKHQVSQSPFGPEDEIGMLNLITASTRQE